MPVSATARIRNLLCGVALLAAGSLAACSSDEPSYPQAPDRIEPLSVRANPEALQPPSPRDTLGVHFRVPRGWAPLGSVAARRVQRSVRVETDALREQPLYTYGEQRTSSFLVVSRLHPVGEAVDVPTSLQSALIARELDFQRVDTLRQESELPLFDFVIATRSAVHHKVVARADRAIVQFDFVTPRFQYPRTVPLIEASVASIRRLQ